MRVDMLASQTGNRGRLESWIGVLVRETALTQGGGTAGVKCTAHRRIRVCLHFAPRQQHHNGGLLFKVGCVRAWLVKINVKVVVLYTDTSGSCRSVLPYVKRTE